MFNFNLPISNESYMLLLVAGIALMLFTFIDILKRDFKDENTRLLWLIVLATLNVIGAILYLAKVYKKQK